MAGGESSGLAFKQAANGEDVHELLDRQRPNHQRTGALPLEEALSLEAAHGLSKRGARNTEPDRDLALSDQLVGLKLTAQEHSRQRVVSHLGERLCRLRFATDFSH